MRCKASREENGWWLNVNIPTCSSLLSAIIQICTAITRHSKHRDMEVSQIGQDKQVAVGGMALNSYIASMQRGGQESMTPQINHTFVYNAWVSQLGMSCYLPNSQGGSPGTGARSVQARRLDVLIWPSSVVLT